MIEEPRVVASRSLILARVSNRSIAAVGLPVARSGVASGIVAVGHEQNHL